MKTRFRFLVPLVGSALSLLPALAASEPDPLQRAAMEVAASGKSASAIRTLRAAGPAGMSALSQLYQPTVEKFQNGMRESALSGVEPAWWRVKTAFDEVGQQKDNYLSQLYWFTDLPAAEAAAQAAGKPILSLRLLGKLNEEYSCANSRFFRTTLYPNAEVASYLRSHFILHWQTVRPVPRITIDMGDGRKIERTITGNSIHYILDAEGRVIDAMPGLYSARAFLAGLQRAENAELSVRDAGTAREEKVRAYHRQEAARIAQNLARDLARTGRLVSDVPMEKPPTKIDAVAASRLATSKSGIEVPMLRADVINNGSDFWSTLSRLQPEVRLDQSTIKLIAAKQPGLEPAMNLALSKSIVETPLSRTLRNLTASIAEDTVRNEYQLHRKLHEWLAAEPTPALAALNTRVYAELFLTPESDPWLGLAPADTFAALDHGGLVEPEVVAKK